MSGTSQQMASPQGPATAISMRPRSSGSPAPARFLSASVRVSAAAGTKATETWAGSKR